MDQAGPGMLLRLRESLNLSEDQVEKLQTLEKGTQESMRTAMQQAREAHQKALDAMHGDTPDLDAHEQALRQAASRMVDAMQAMAKVQVQARQVLNADQKKTLDTIMEAMEEMHEGAGMRPGMGQGQHPGMRPEQNGMPGRPSPHGGGR